MRARSLAEIREQGNVTTHQRLQARTHRAEDGTRTNNDAANDAEIAFDPVTFQRERGGHHVGIYCGELFFHDPDLSSGFSFPLSLQSGHDPALERQAFLHAEPL